MIQLIYMLMEMLIKRNKEFNLLLKRVYQVDGFRRAAMII